MSKTVPKRRPEQRFERIPTEIHSDPRSATAELAQEIANLIREKESKGESAVLGLATGSTPVPLYRELIRLHREEQLSFANVVTFNLDEYFGLNPDHPESYARFMADQLFDHVDILPENAHVPSGTVSTEEVFASCAAYEEAIEAAGGIDLQILGIGRTGHIGFNEPGSAADSLTRRVTLDRLTRLDAAQDFLGEENVPRFAITMGVGTILAARRVVLMAWGEGKAEVVHAAVEKEPSPTLPASFLQSHANAAFLVDEAAAGQLTRIRSPWLVEPVAWNSDHAQRRGVTWLAERTTKPVLRLVDEDYNENGMGDLLTAAGSAYQLNIDIFNVVGHTITGWPGGKRDAPPGEETRPEKSLPYPKVCVVLAPEPQDDVIGMGGTIDRLRDQGHEVHLVYMTSGSLRVPDQQVFRFASVLRDAGTLGEGDWTGAVDYAGSVLEELEAKGRFGADTERLRQIKGVMRREEAREVADFLEIPASQVHFLDLPFYEKGRYRRFQIGPDDVAKVAALLGSITPDQIYATGNLADPSSHRALCFHAAAEALDELKGEAWMASCSRWLYRVGERPFDVWEIVMAVPMSPGQLEKKVQAIGHYRSDVVSSGLDGEGNLGIARAYDRLGLAEYEAIEAFERWP